MKTLTCCIIDDEPLALDLISQYVEKTSFLKLVAKFQSASQAIQTILQEEIDVLFLDIQMAELNGIEFAKVVPSSTRIIFITAFQQYAFEGFKANAIDYLLKPVSYSEFLVAANKALQWFELNSGSTEKRRTALSSQSIDSGRDFIIVKSEYKLIQIPLDDILYIEGLKDYVKIYLEGQSQPVVSLMVMKTVEHNLPADRFMRVHRSFIVQMSKIKVIERNRIVFGKEYIPISETYKNVVNDYINKHSIIPIREE